LTKSKNFWAKDLDPMDTVGNRTYFQLAIYEGQPEIFKVFFNHSGNLLESYQKQDLLFLSIKEKQREIYNYLSKETLFEDHKPSLSTCLELNGRNRLEG
jgi:hypothetical protein